MEDNSEKAIKAKCPHCDLSSQAFSYPLFETENFHVVCDANPLIEGHVLIIPKEHISCIAEYSDSLFTEFEKLYKEVSIFIKKEYGSVSTFEHGIYGQTVFHSHIHLLPFSGNPEIIVPEGSSKFKKIENLSKLKKLFEKDGGYLYFSIGEDVWSVDVDIVAPRFFRDRFAKAIGRPERGNWKEMVKNEKIMQEVSGENKRVQEKWRSFDSK